MAKEKDELPTKPKCLVNMDPTKFHPDWAKQGRRTRRFLAKKTYEDVEDAFYKKGIVRVEILAAVDDSRKVLDVLCSAPPGTPIAEFTDYHKKEMEDRVRKSQLMISDGCKIFEAGTMDYQSKFEALREKFNAEKPTRYEVEDDIVGMREKAKPLGEFEMPKPRVPVYCMVASEAQIYMQELMDFIVKQVLKLKKTDFRRWPQVLGMHCTYLTDVTLACDDTNNYAGRILTL